MRIRAGSLCQTAAVWFGTKTALTALSGDGTTVLTQNFHELNASANQIGSGLRALGIQRGDRIGVLAYNVPEVMHLWLGCEAHNLVRAVLHTHFSMSAHIWSLDQMQASALAFDTRFTADVQACRDKLRTVKHFIAIGANPPDWAIPYDTVLQKGSPENPDLDVDENAPCFLQLTSGTTGRPKSWVKSYRSWTAVIDHNLHHFDTFGPQVPPVGPDDVNLHFHALQWATGFQTLYPYLVRGARTVLLDDEKFDPDIIVDVMTREKVTGTFTPGPLWGPILDAVQQRTHFQHTLRRVVIFFGSPELQDRTTALLGPIWAHGFGSTEQGAITTRLLPHEVDENPRRRDSVGRSGSPFFEIAIMDPDGHRLGPNQLGEIAVRSAMSLGEYWDMPEKTKEASFPGDWFRPFDVGYLDEDGFLYYADRATDTIKTAQGVVYPHLVEAVISRHEAVALCGVVGLGETGQQTVVAAVQLKSGRRESGELTAQILAACHELDAQARPEQIIYQKELPTVLGGAKVQRSELRKRLTA